MPLSRSNRIQKSRSHSSRVSTCTAGTTWSRLILFCPREPPAKSNAQRSFPANGSKCAENDKIPTEWEVNPAVHDGRFAQIAETERVRRAGARENILREAAVRQS